MFSPFLHLRLYVHVHVGFCNISDEINTFHGKEKIYSMCTSRIFSRKISITILHKKEKKKEVDEVNEENVV